MTVADIVYEYLKASSYDGLCTDDGCGCHIDDLFPCCQERCLDCVPGYAVPEEEAQVRGVYIEEGCIYAIVKNKGVQG